MSGAGSLPAGGGAGAGIDQDPTVPAARNVRPPHALYLDASVMDFPLDENGRYVEVHPVDHLAEMLLIPERGSMAAAPEQGSPWLSLEIDTEAVMTQRATEIVQARWAALISRGDIGQITVRAHASAAGRARVYVQYVNNRDPKKDPANPFRTVEIL